MKSRLGSSWKTPSGELLVDAADDDLGAGDHVGVHGGEGLAQLVLGADAAGEGQEEVMMETGLPLRQELKTGRESQSRAFLSTPGTPWLYSGVRRGLRRRREASLSGVDGGELGVDVEVFVVERDVGEGVELGDRWRAAWRASSLMRAVLKDTLRRLPEMPAMRTVSVEWFMVRGAPVDCDDRRGRAAASIKARED